LVDLRRFTAGADDDDDVVPDVVDGLSRDECLGLLALLDERVTTAATYRHQYRLATL